jgi:hypothetical protein
MVQGLEDYYSAADIYLDSIPFASLTSLLDAALRGIPVLALSETAANSVLTSNDLSLMDHNVHYSDREDYIRAVTVLARRPDERLRQGEVTRRTVVEDHLSPGWNNYLDRIFEPSTMSSTDSLDAPARHEVPISGLSRLEEALVGFQSASGLAEPLWAARLRDAPYMSAWDRVLLLRSIPRGHRLGAMNFMVPDAHG